MMMTLTGNPVDQSHRFLEWCCCSVATGLAIAGSVTRVTTRRRSQHVEYGPLKFNSFPIRNHSLKIRPLRIQAHQFNRGGTISKLSKTSSSLQICAAAFNSTFFKTETEPRPSRQRQTATTILSPFGGTSKSPELDDGGGPNGGGDGGWKFEFYRGEDGDTPGGGGDWSGEFYIILFILFLVLLRDRTEEKRIQKEEEDRRM